jgi:hypothetical protein
MKKTEDQKREDEIQKNYDEYQQYLKMISNVLD